MRASPVLLEPAAEDKLGFSRLSYADHGEFEISTKLSRVFTQIPQRRRGG